MTITWNRAATMSSCRTIFADPISAAAGADLLRKFDHLLDARQMVWQMAKVAFGGRASGFAIGVAFGQRILRGFSLGNRRFQILESQLARIGRQLLGSLAIKRMAQLGDQVILSFGPRLQSCDLGLDGSKRCARRGPKAVQITGEIGGADMSAYTAHP